MTGSDRQTWLTGGAVVDGTGAPARRADVVVQDDVIRAVLAPGQLPPQEAQVEDVTGLVVCPGFIDTHSHADNVPFLADDDTTKIRQGVTTEVVGNCGFSLAPIDPATAGDFATLAGRIFPPMRYPWSSFSEYLAHADAAGYVTNYAPLVGHNVLRVAAFGSVDRAPDPAEQALMGALLDDALEAGAFGLSSGLVYPPGLFAGPDEVATLAARLGTDRVYATHMRNETRRVRASLDEALGSVVEHAGRLHVSHLKIADRAHWGSMPQMLGALDDARAAGRQVTQDVYPYAAGSTMLTAVLPPWFHDGGGEAVLGRLGSVEALERAERDLVDADAPFENYSLAAGWENIVVSSTGSHRHEGRSIADLAAQKRTSPLRAVAELLREEELAATMVLHMMDEADVVSALRHPMTAIGSDGLPPGTGGRPHPRTCGTFPRVLGHHVRAGDLGLEEAVRRMTSLAAEIFAVPQRGRVAAGQVADLVCLDPATIADTATYEEPTTGPTGIHRVYQGGSLVVRDGVMTGSRAGRRLTPAPR